MRQNISLRLPITIKLKIIYGINKYLFGLIVRPNQFLWVENYR